jgi:uncharacterized membrane protein
VADRPFAVGDAFNWGWTKFQQNAGTIVVAALIYVVIVVVIEAVILLAAIRPALDTKCTYNSQGLLESCSVGPGFFVTLVLYGVGGFIYAILFAFLQAGIVRGALQIANGQPLELQTMFKFDNIANVLLGGIIVGIASFIGILLCGVGYLVVAVFTPFWIFFVLDKNMSAWDAVMASVRLVNSNLGSVIVLIIGVIIAYVIGALLCGIGLIVAAPVALLALTYGYRKLQNEPIAA